MNRYNRKREVLFYASLFLRVGVLNSTRVSLYVILLLIMMTSPPTIKENNTSPDRETTEYNVFRILQALRKNIRAIQGFSRKLLTKLNVTVPQLKCLKAIDELDTPNLLDVSRAVYLSPRTVSGIVSRLEGKHFVIRDYSESDKNHQQLTLTDVGREIIVQAPTLQEDLIADGLNSIPVEKQEQLVHSIECIVELLDAQHLDAAPILETGPIDQTLEMKQALHLLEDSHMQTQQLFHKESEHAGSVEKVEMEIRRAEWDDMDEISDFIRSSEAWYQAIIHEKDMGEHSIGADWAEKNFKRREFYVGVADGKKVGTISIQDFGRVLYLGYIYINTDYVGKGFGHQLMAFAEAEGKRRGKDAMVLIAHPKATWAVKAYRKFGFDLQLSHKADILNWEKGVLEDYYEEGFQLYSYDLTKIDKV